MVPKEAIQELTVGMEYEVPTKCSVLITATTCPRKEMLKPTTLKKRPQSLTLQCSPTATALTSNYTEHSSPLFSSSRVPKNWLVGDDESAVPALPFMYPLQAHVKSELPPSTIASNVEDTLQRLSVTATFDSPRAICYARTMDGVEFTIQMFSSNKCSKGGGRSTIVELHRTTAPKFGFQTIVQTIFLAVTTSEGLFVSSDSQPTPKRRKVTMMPEFLDNEDDEHGQGNNNNSNDKVDVVVKNSLYRVSSLLRKDRLDANRLGTESLVVLTDPQISGEDVSSRVARAVLSVGDTTPEVGDCLYHLIVYGRLTCCDDDGNDNGNDGCDDNVHDGNYVGTLKRRMRYDALRVLAQCLDMSSDQKQRKDDNVNDKDVDVDEDYYSSRWFGEEMLAVLRHDVAGTNTTTNPHGAHMAHAAVRCLRSMSGHPTVRMILQQHSGLKDAVEGAFRVGRCAHERLATESKELMNVLRS